MCIRDRGENVKLNDVLIVDDDQLGAGGGSGFQYTIQSNNTGITSVTNISTTGEGYQVGDVLSVDDTNVGGGGGSGFQFTTNQVGFASSATINTGGQAFELADTLILGLVGGSGVTQGTGLALSIATLNPTKSLELSQAGDFTLGKTGSTQVLIKPDGQITTSTWSINASGLASLTSITSSGNVSITGTLGVSSTSTFTGMATFNGGITVSGADSSIDRAAVKLIDGSASTPSLTFSDASSNTTGFFKQAANKIGVTFSGTEGVRLDGTNYLDTKGLVIDATLGSTTPFFKVETTTPKLSIGTAAANIAINNATTISTEGTDIDVPLTFDTKGGGDFTFKGGANVDLIVDDGTTEVFKLETSTGTATFSGNLDAGKLRLRQNVVQNNSTLATRAFGECVAVAVTGTGSGYTDGTYTATATTSTGGGTGCTVTVTVASGTFSAVTIVDKGQNYAVGDTLLITAAGSGSGISITVTDIDGQGVVLKPTAGSSVLVDTTGSLVIPAGTTNERPTTLDRITGAVRFNTSQLQFEGFNGNDFVSLGGVRDVDQDTYILTESSPGADEDTFEYYAAGVNNLSISQSQFTFRSSLGNTKYDGSHTATVDGTYTLSGTVAGQSPFTVNNIGTNVLTVTSKNAVEVIGGFNFRNVPALGLATGIDQASITQTAGAYTTNFSNTTVTGSTSNLDGSGIRVVVAVNTGSNTVTGITIDSVQGSGGSNYAVGEIVTVLGTALGGLSPANDVTFKISSLSTNPSVVSDPISRLDILQSEFTTRMSSKPFLNLDGTGSESAWQINRGWNAGTESYLTVFDSTATFMELDDCRVEGGQLSSFPTTASIIQFDKTAYKGGKTLVTIQSDDGKVHMLEVTSVCCLLYTSPSPRDLSTSRMPSSA